MLKNLQINRSARGIKMVYRAVPKIAKIRLGCAKDRGYYLVKNLSYNTAMYARLCHVYLNGQGTQKSGDLVCYYLSVALELDFYHNFRILYDATICIIKKSASEVYKMALKKQNFTKTIEYYQSTLGNTYLESAAKNISGVYMHLEKEHYDQQPVFYLHAMQYYEDETVQDHKASLEDLLVLLRMKTSVDLYLIRKINENKCNGQPDSTNNVYSIASVRG
ncbi:hypothetical protein K501DRAFT_278171 [Backusella circina FSU 941]|nr:hypothetical protein K501DRAFT_278171 [Backusella circina FSU 941]